MRWQSKRLTNDLALHQTAVIDDATPVSRANRLGRAAAGAGSRSAVRILGVFDHKHWNGRLQAPRAQLHKLAKIRDNATVPEPARRQKYERGLSTIRWILTFSPRLQQKGPWLEYAAAQNLSAKSPHFAENRGRGWLAQHLLGRLDGLRILSVDLGQRYAAACAVWEAMSGDQVRATCASAGAPEPDKSALSIRVSVGGRRTILRRVGEDAWARLDRCFVIRLAGEDVPARKASPAEIQAVQTLCRELGYSDASRAAAAVDKLMSYALRVLRLGLQRHARRAMVVFGLAAKEKVVLGNQLRALSEDERTDSIGTALADWWTFAVSSRWPDPHAAALWDEHIADRAAGIELPPDLESFSFRERLLVREKLLKDVRPIAQALRPEEVEQLTEIWRLQWLGEEARWCKRLRWIKDWLLPRGSGAQCNSIRRVGGLSLRRLNNLRALYRLEKSFAGRLRVGVGGHRCESQVPSEEFGRKTLTALERLRENRVKQTASRIVAAALGLGKDLKRGHGERFAPCHAVVIENLTNYRPDEVRSRRENRQLMDWCAAKVKKYLNESCDLHGILLREVQAAYTSRQDSLTGAPGVRCADVPIRDFMACGGYWERELRRADKANSSGRSDARSRYLIALRDRISAAIPYPAAAATKGAVRIPVDGGPVFVSADPQSPAAHGTQADMNAAANIGLRALLDPDWAGRWWYVPCNASTGVPVADGLKGSALIQPNLTLFSSHNGAEKKPKRQVVNLWRDVSARPLNVGIWRTYAQYRASVMERVTAILLTGLQTLGDDVDLPF